MGVVYGAFVTAGDNIRAVRVPHEEKLAKGSWWSSGGSEGRTGILIMT